MTAKTQQLGFIGLGVMGEPMCRHLKKKSGAAVIAYDLVPEPLNRLQQFGVEAARSAVDVVARAEIVFLSLPSGKQLKEICEGPQGLLAITRAGQTVVDLGTSPVGLSRELAGKFAQKGVRYADAPVARTRQAAEDGTLAITVGAPSDLFARIEPLLRCFASEVTHCGDVGTGQLLKILNNMVVVGTVVVLSEAAAIAESAGFDTRKLFETFTKGSADSFALRNHGLKSVAAGEFPKRAFSTEYMLKDVTYALQMAQEGGVAARSAENGRKLLSQALEEGWKDEYWPVISKIIARGSDKT